MTRRAGSCQRGGFSSITWREIWTTTRKGSECRRSFMVGKLFRRQADRGRWGGRGRALDSFRRSMAIQIVIEEWEGSRKRVQTSILPTPMWLLLYVRSVWSPVLLEVSVSAPYVCKYKALPQLWGPGMDVRRWRSEKQGGPRNRQRAACRPPLAGLQHCKRPA